MVVVEKAGDLYITLMGNGFRVRAWLGLCDCLGIIWRGVG